MDRLLLFIALAGIAGAVAVAVRQRSTPDPPTQTSWSVPTQLDRADFAGAGAPWLVAVFSSATCLSCKGTWEKVTPLASDEVAVDDVEAVARRAIHEKYRIDAVPCVVVADAEGVVRASFLGEPSTADLWASLAEVRQPGSVPPGCDHGMT
jgi:hypothetical protein